MSNVIQHVLLILGADEKDKPKAKKGDKTLRCLEGYSFLFNFFHCTNWVCFVTEPTAKKEKTKSDAVDKKGEWNETKQAHHPDMNMTLRSC